MNRSRIDSGGAAVAASVAQSNAAPLLQAAALKLVSALRSASASAAEARYRMGVRFCRKPCSGPKPFPGDDELVVTARGASRAP